MVFFVATKRQILSLSTFDRYTYNRYTTSSTIEATDKTRYEEAELNQLLPLVSRSALDLGTRPLKSFAGYTRTTEECIIHAVIVAREFLSTIERRRLDVRLEDCQRGSQPLRDRLERGESRRKNIGETHREKKRERNACQSSLTPKSSSSSSSIPKHHPAVGGRWGCTTRGLSSTKYCIYTSKYTTRKRKRTFRKKCGGGKTRAQTIRVNVYLHVAGAKIHLEIHGGVTRGRRTVLAVWRRQMMGMKGVQLLGRVELLMMKGRLVIAAEGVPPRLVPRSAATPRAAPAAGASADASATTANPQHASSSATPDSATHAAATAASSTSWNLVRACLTLPPAGPT